MDLLHDPRRLADLRALAILDTPPERDYDDLAAMAAARTGSRIAAVNLVDDERHFTKAITGSPGSVGQSVAADESFCAAALREPDGLLLVPDTTSDPRFADHPSVTGGAGVGFYMGAAIVLDDQRVGVVCAFGPEPREIEPRDRTALVELADQAAAQLRLRKHRGR